MRGVSMITGGPFAESCSPQLEPASARRPWQPPGESTSPRAHLWVRSGVSRVTETMKG